MKKIQSKKKQNMSTEFMLLFMWYIKENVSFPWPLWWKFFIPNGYSWWNFRAHVYIQHIFSHALRHIYLSMHVSGKIPAKQLSNHKWSGREVQSSCFWKWLNSFLSPSSDFKHWDVFWTLRKRKLCKITYTCITCTTMWYVVYIRY